MNSGTEDGPRSISLDGIQRRLPHRYPFLLVDRVLDYGPGEWLLALKNVTANEPFFGGHFPQQAIMPGVLLIEGMAQACGLLAFVTREHEPDAVLPEGAPLFYLVGVDDAKFKRPVIPGDALQFRVSLQRVVRGIWLFQGQAHVDGRLAAAADIRCTMREV